MPSAATKTAPTPSISLLPRRDEGEVDGDAASEGNIDKKKGVKKKGKEKKEDKKKGDKEDTDGNKT
jgi:hypothetical protein